MCLWIDLLPMNKAEYTSGKRACSSFKLIFNIFLEKQGKLYKPPGNIADIWTQIQTRVFLNTVQEYHHSAVTFGNMYYRLDTSTTLLSILY